MAFGEKRPVEHVEWPLLAMTLPEVAAALRVNQRTVLDLLAKSDFPGRKIGNGWRFEPEAIKEWLRQGKGRVQFDDLPSTEDEPAKEPVKAAGPISKKQLQEHLPEVQKMFKLKNQPEAQA